MSVRENDFERIRDLFDCKKLYVVPTFQRPFAWGKREINDLWKDLNKLVNQKDKDTTHYLSSIHLVQIKEQQDLEKVKEIIPQNQELTTILKNLDEERLDERVFLVIDGQQRLTTLYMIWVLCSLGDESDNFLKIKSLGNKKVSKIFLNSQEDQDYLMRLLSNQIPEPKSLSQKKLKEIYERILEDWKPNKNKWKDVLDKRVEILMVELPYKLATTSFITLNDRGKPITSLEKLKAFMIEQALLLGGDIAPQDIHLSFGELYNSSARVVFEKIFSEAEVDDRMIQYLFVYSELKEDKNNYRQLGDAAYQKIQEYFEKAEDKIAKLWEYRGNISNLAKTLNKVLQGFCETEKSSIIYPGKSSLADDYKVIIKALGLHPLSFILLTKYNDLFKESSFHEKCEIVLDSQRLSNISQDIKNYIGKAMIALKEEISNQTLKSFCSFLEKIQGELEENIENKASISILELVEKIEVSFWKTGSQYYGTFHSCWQNIEKINEPEKFLDVFIRSDFSYPWYFIENLFRDKPKVFKYILKEYNRGLDENIRFKSIESLELEHVFPKEYYSSREELEAELGKNFDGECKQIIFNLGNLVLISGTLNQKVSNELPLYKKEIYKNWLNKEPFILKLLIKQLECCKNLRDILTLLKLRTIELAIFAITRFLPQYRHLNSDFCQRIREFWGV